MANKVAYRYRVYLFALVMSANTALIVPGIIIYLHSTPNTRLMMKWLTAFVTAWPIVFVAILIIAPLVNRFLNLFVEER
jgi:hypothetical protein